MATNVTQKLTTAQNITGATVNFEYLDVLNYTTVSCHVKTAGAGLTGTAKLEQSNDGSVWVDFPATQYPNASKAIVSNGSVMLEVPHCSAVLVRLSVAVSVGTAATTYYMYAKEH
jgi:hypothetical protein